MRRATRQLAAVLTLLCLSIAPLLPPAHLHRHTDRLGHAQTLVHRHFAPHAIAIGAHVARPGAEDGAPAWLDDPCGVPASAPLVATDAAVAVFFGLNPPPDVDLAAPPLDAPIHSPPHRPTGLRAPPSRSEPIDVRLVRPELCEGESDEAYDLVGRRRTALVRPSARSRADVDRTNQ
jgi:hypothetical protein